MHRTTTEVIEDHLVKRLKGQVEEDLADNFSKDIIILSSFGVFEGHDGVRKSADKLKRDIGDAQFAYNHTQIEGRYALLEWSAHKEEKKIVEGADSFVVEDGKIIMQTIHYHSLD